MSRTRIKICGVTNVADASFAATAGADAIGLVFYGPSPRAVTISHARAIVEALPPLVSTVALFVNAPSHQIVETIETVRPALLQFHGEEDATFCSQFGVPYLKAMRIGTGTGAGDLLEYANSFHAARALLLDSLSPGLYGGSGESFDWNVIPEQMRSRILLSGGLHPGNVAEAVRRIRPWAVDVSSGVELTKGVKDHARISRFIEEVRNADAS